MAEEPVHPMAAAMQWVARVFAAALVMTLPGIGGRHLDQRWGTSWIGAVGFAAGLIVGVAYLIAITRAEDASTKANRGAKPTRDDDRSSDVSHRR